MTVCIAALADSSKKLVVASDRMTTSTIGGIEYEWEAEDVQKIFPITGFNGAVLMAGADSYGRTIIQSSLKSLEEKKPKKLEEAVEIFRSEYQKFRLNNFIHSVLESKGMTLGDYYNLHAKLANDLRVFIDNQLAQWNAFTELIIAGQDSGEDFHIYTVSNPGVVLNHDSNGYICVGKGGPHAMYFLIGSGYKKSLRTEEVKQFVLDGKQKSEKAPGVGKLTDCRTFP